MKALLAIVAVLPTIVSFVPVFFFGKPPTSYKAAPLSLNEVVPSSNKTGSKGLRTLYPPIKAYFEGTLHVDSVHTLAYREFGNPEGLPALFLHGGPGAGCFDNHARFFDPKVYRIVLLDQRGCGCSKPKGEWRRNNTLLHLVQDCEQLRLHLNIREWSVVLGGSWGATLGLAYATLHPIAMDLLILRGVCMMRLQEIDWLFSSTSHLATMVDPESWKRFETAFEKSSVEKDDPRMALHVHYDRLLGEDPLNRIEAARSWMMREYGVSALNRSDYDPEAPVLIGRGNGQWFNNDTKHGDETNTLSNAEVAIALQRLRRTVSLHSLAKNTTAATFREPETVKPHVNTSTANITEAAQLIPCQAMLTCFFSVNTDYAMNGIKLLDRITPFVRSSVRCIAVHGAIDNICPVNNALDLKSLWPEVELRIPLKAGHSMYDDAITHELILATEQASARSITPTIPDMMGHVEVK